MKCPKSKGGGWFSICKKRGAKCPKSKVCGGLIFYMGKKRREMSKVLDLQWFDFLYGEKAG